MVEVSCILRCLVFLDGEAKEDSVSMRFAGESKLLLEHVKIFSCCGFFGEESSYKAPLTFITSPGGVLSFSNCSY